MMYDMAYSSLTQTESLGECTKRNTFGVLSPNLLRYENIYQGSSVSLFLGLPILSDLISVVIQRTANKQMIGVNTSRIVARVTDLHACADLPKVVFVGQSRGSKRSAAPTPSPYPSVSIFVASEFPQPASFGLINIAPESFHQGFRGSHKSTLTHGVKEVN